MAPRLNVPPLTRGLIVALVSLSFLNGLLRYREYVSLSAKATNVIKYGSIVSEPYLVIFPKYSYTYPWVLLSATFVEQNILGLILSGVTIFFGGRYLERAWSSAEFAKFMLFTAMIPNLLSFFIYLVLAASISDHNPVINGTPALQSALLVSFKQLVPEHTVSIFRNLIRIRVKHFPTVHLLFQLISAILLGTHTSFTLALFGFVTSWTYLRFYKASPSLTDSSTSAAANIRGDASDTFAFAYFFPEPLHTAVAKIADAIYEGLVAIHVCTPFSTEDVESHNEQATARAEGGLPSIMNPSRSSRNIGSSRAEAERRRALALKALDQRLQAGSVTSGGGTSQPFGTRASPPGTVPSVQTPVSGSSGQATAPGPGEKGYALEEQPGPKIEEK